MTAARGVPRGTGGIRATQIVMTLALAVTLVVACSPEPAVAPAPAVAQAIPPAKPAGPASSGALEEFVLVRDVRIALIWDEATQSTRRKIGGREYPDDAELEKAISAAHALWVKKGLPDAPVTIDADPRVPWTEVVKVVNVSKRCGIEKIEFAMGAPPLKPGDK